MKNKNVTTAAGIVFFDDEKGLQRCLEFHTGVRRPNNCYR